MKCNTSLSECVHNFAGHKYPSVITLACTTHGSIVYLKGNDGINYLQNFPEGLHFFWSTQIFILYHYLYLFVVKVNYSTELILN